LSFIPVITETVLDNNPLPKELTADKLIEYVELIYKFEE
jgi:hypothetical protein